MQDMVARMGTLLAGLGKPHCPLTVIRDIVPPSQPGVYRGGEGGAGGTGAAAGAGGARGRALGGAGALPCAHVPSDKHVFETKQATLQSLASSLALSACHPITGANSVRAPDPIGSALQGTAARRYWSCPGNADLRVRGKNYLVVSGKRWSTDAADYKKPYICRTAIYLVVSRKLQHSPWQH